MGFNFNGPRGQNNNSNGQQDDSWKAQAFINLYLPTKDGGKRKLGVIALKETKPAEKALIDWLKANPEAGAKALLSKLEINFQLADGNTGAQFDLEVPTGT